MIKTIITSNTITDTAKNIQRSYLVLKLIYVGWKVFSIALNLHSIFFKKKSTFNFFYDFRLLFFLCLDDSYRDTVEAEKKRESSWTILIRTKYL